MGAERSNDENSQLAGSDLVMAVRKTAMHETGMIGFGQARWEVAKDAYTRYSSVVVSGRSAFVDGLQHDSGHCRLCTCR